MTYLHKVDVKCEMGPAIRHYRESALSSGLLTVSEIGRTMIKSAADAPSSEVILPSQLEIEMFSGEPAIFDVLESSIQVNELSEFVPKGIEAWDQLCSKLGISSARAFLAEALRGSIETEDIHDSGIIETKAPSQPEFVGFEATTEELEHMHKLEAKINRPQPVNSTLPTGLYL